MDEMAKAVAVWLLGLGGIGFAIGLVIVFTMSAPARWRAVAGGGVLAASVVGIGLVVIGMARPTLGFFAAPILIPALTGLGLRIYIQSRCTKSRATKHV